MSRYKTAGFPGLPRFTGGGVGYFAYDAVRLVEDIPDTTRDDYGTDDIFFMFYDTILVFDNIGTTISIISNVHTAACGSIEYRYNSEILRNAQLQMILS